MHMFCTFFHDFIFDVELFHLELIFRVFVAGFEFPLK